jgi:hypothetical protein
MRQFAASTEDSTKNDWDWRSPLDDDDLNKEKEALLKAKEHLKSFVS